MKRILIALALTLGMTLGMTVSVMSPANADWNRSEITYLHSDLYQHYACKKVRGSEVKVHTFSYGKKSDQQEIGVYSVLLRQGKKIVEKTSMKREKGRIRTILVTSSATPQDRVWVQGAYYGSDGNKFEGSVAVSTLKECPWQ